MDSRNTNSNPITNINPIIKSENKLTALYDTFNDVSSQEKQQLLELIMGDFYADKGFVTTFKKTLETDATLQAIFKELEEWRHNLK